MSDADHIVLVGFDGLRPDLVSPHTTPNLAALAASGTVLPNHRAVFPTETRVNLASLVTGGSAAEHGLVSNRFLDPSLTPEAALDTGALAVLERLDGHAGRPLIGLPHLGTQLAAAGRTLAVLHTGSEGAAAILGWSARRHQHFVFNPRFAGSAQPKGVERRLCDRYGIGANSMPKDLPRLITDIFIDEVWPTRRPTMSILWFVETDKACHDYGPGAPGHLASVDEADAQLGRLMDWRATLPDGDRICLMALSDHGHITLDEPVSLIDTLRDAGLNVADHLAGDADLAAIVGLSPGIWARGGDVGLLQAAYDALSAQPWLGIAFSEARGDGVDGIIRGTLAHHIVQADHPRSPHLRITYRGDDRLNAYGLAGCSAADPKLSRRRRGDGHHGGLHRKELESVFVVSGAAFKPGCHRAVWSGSADIPPTALAALGLPAAAGSHGRVLTEILVRSGPSNALSPELDEVTHRVGDTVHRLRRVSVGGAVYLDGVSTVSA